MKHRSERNAFLICENLCSWIRLALTTASMAYTAMILFVHDIRGTGIGGFTFSCGRAALRNPWFGLL
jgi:hypothetical protein